MWLVQYRVTIRTSSNAIARQKLFEGNLNIKDWWFWSKRSNVRGTKGFTGGWRRIRKEERPRVNQFFVCSQQCSLLPNLPFLSLGWTGKFFSKYWSLAAKRGKRLCNSYGKQRRQAAVAQNRGAKRLRRLRAEAVAGEIKPDCSLNGNRTAVLCRLNTSSLRAGQILWIHSAAESAIEGATW